MQQFERRSCRKKHFRRRCCGGRLIFGLERLSIYLQRPVVCGSQNSVNLLGHAYCLRQGDRTMANSASRSHGGCWSRATDAVVVCTSQGSWTAGN